MEDNRNRDRFVRLGGAAAIAAVIAAGGYAIYNYYAKKPEEALYAHGPSRGPSRRSSTSSTMCPICFEEMSGTRKILSCSHSFHSKCIGEWSKVNNTCPMCRVPLNL